MEKHINISSEDDISTMGIDKAVDYPEEYKDFENITENQIRKELADYFKIDISQRENY